VARRSILSYGALSGVSMAPFSRVYIGAGQWSPKAEAGSFADLTIEAAVRHARRGPLGLNPEAKPGVISVFDVDPDAKAKMIDSFGDKPRRTKGLDFIFDGRECLILNPAKLRYAGFNLVNASDAKILGEGHIELRLRQVTHTMLSTMHATATAWDVNDGQCEDWAQAALTALGGDPIRGVGGNVYWFNEFLNEMMRAEGLPETDEDGDNPISHAVLSYAGRWYDAQHPRGVDTLSSLSIARRVGRTQWREQG